MDASEITNQSLHGAGAFGHWGTDEAGRACFHYNPPPGRDAPQEDHWHLIGNERISVTCHNAGYVQLYDWTRGPKILNRWHPKSGNYAGGFVYVRAHGITFPTLKPWLPEGATMERVFGQGYFKKVTRWRGLVVEEEITVLPGDTMFIFCQTSLENTGTEPVELSFTPFWQPNLRQLVVAPIMTNGMDKWVEGLRARLNRKYEYRLVSNPRIALTEAWCKRTHGRKAKAAPAFADHYPEFMTFGDFAEWDDSLVGLINSPIDFFGYGGFGAPDGMDTPVITSGERHHPAYPQGPVLCSLRRITLTPGEGQSFESGFYLHSAHTGDDKFAEDLDQESENDERYYFPAIRATLPDYPYLARETEWHSYYLQACTLYSEYFNAHFVDQGSAYGYLQGASGAPRDYALFVLALVYLRPDLAKETLRFLFRTQKHKDGGFPYATFGYGKASGGGVHSLSSDLDLFVFWALAEYLNVTRDFAFLEEDNVYYPKADGKHGTVLDHVRASWQHLTKKIGLGPHGLIRCGTGDWNDVLIAFSRVPPLTIWRGESSLNAGLATVALPALADALQQADPALAQDMRALAAQQAEALQQMWTGQWVARGYTGWRDKQLGVDRIFLDTQAFGVLGGVWNSEQRDTLFDNIQRICVDPQPAGALALYPPMRGPLLVPGSDTNGGTWAAVDGWTTLAWMQHDPAAAWQFYLRTTMAARAEAYPENWYGIWSGPDAFNAHYHRKPAETFNHNATPMHLFPIMNANRHALPLLDLVKFAGFGARGGRINYAPKLPFDTFAVNTPLMGCTYAPDRCEGYYTPVVDGVFKFSVTLPKELQGKPILLKLGESSQVLSPSGDCEIYFEHTCVTAEAIRWEVGEAP
jgi:hypothetical protein